MAAMWAAKVLLYQPFAPQHHERFFTSQLVEHLVLPWVDLMAEVMVAWPLQQHLLILEHITALAAAVQATFASVAYRV
jgi:hypothetical protein